jgi:hypothetical protein
LVGPCDACGRLTELFQLPGRKDNNCPECNTDIATLVLLYGGLTIAQRGAENTAELEATLVLVLHRFLGRLEVAPRNSSARVSGCHAASRKLDLVN